MTTASQTKQANDLQFNNDDIDEKLELNITDKPTANTRKINKIVGDNIIDNEKQLAVAVAQSSKTIEDAAGDSLQENKKVDLPSVTQLKQELREVRHKKQYGRVLRSTVYVLLISAACAVLVATIFFPILQIYGSSMEPTLSENEIVIAFKTTDFEKGDLVAFYVGNKLLVKRYIAGPGQWVDIDDEGNVFVDGELIDEPYIQEKAIGPCNIELPYQVPENKYFVLGDKRSTSVDSRNTAVGCIDDDEIVGKILFRVWPLGDMGIVN